MLNGSELTTAIAAVLIGAVCTGFLLHWLWSHLNRSRTSDRARLDEMAGRLHEADMAREAADVARHQAEVLLARREAETSEQLAVMQTRLDGAVEGREAELSRELAAAKLELETMLGGLSNARRRMFELEAEIEALRAAAG
jgi:formate dehydrogenase maturation protein FdhE